MNKLSKMKYIASGFLIGAIFFGSVGYAASSQINVIQDKIKFIVNGLIDDKSANGTFNNSGTTVPSAFIYKGTSYVPIRMVSQLVGVPIKWDGANKSVIIGNEKNKYLSDMIADSIVGKLEANVKYDTPSKNLVFSTYRDSSTVKSTASAEYLINKESKNLSFEAVANKQTMKLTIMGDGKNLWNGVFTDGQTSGEIKIDVSNVTALKIIAEQQSENDIMEGDWGQVKRTLGIFGLVLEMK